MENKKNAGLWIATILVLIVLVILGTLKFAGAQDTIRVDTFYAYHTQVTQSEESTYLTPEMFGANRWDQQPDCAALQRMADAATSGELSSCKLSSGGRYIIINPVIIRGREVGQIYIEAYGANVVGAATSLLFHIEGRENMHKAIGNRIFWKGGTYTSSRGFMRLESMYGCRFEDMNLNEFDTAFVAQWTMNTIFEMNFFTKVGIGVVIQPLTGDYTASTTNLFHMNRVWSNHGQGFVHIYKGNHFSLVRNIVEGQRVDRPVLVDFQLSGVGKTCIMQSNYFEAESDAAITLKHCNGTTFDIRNTTFSSSTHTNIDADYEHSFTTINYHANASYPNHVFKANNKTWWNFTGYNKEYFKPTIIWETNEPFYWRGQGGKRHRL